jgi:hypothetical protein
MRRRLHLSPPAPAGGAVAGQGPLRESEPVEGLLTPTLCPPAGRGQRAIDSFAAEPNGGRSLTCDCPPAA